MYQSRLNVFQRVIQQWDRVHPYNAAQLMTLHGQWPAQHILDTWRDTAIDLELGPIHVDGPEYRFEPPPDPARIPAPGILPHEQAIQAHLSTELNRPFADRDWPIRPFIAASDNLLHAGLVYQHWIADSVSIQQIMRHWLMRITGRNHDARTPLQPPPGGYWHCLGPRQAGWSLPGALGRATADFFRYRGVCKLRTAGSRDHRVQVLLRSTPAGWLETAHARARAHNATLTDLFLSTLADLGHRHLPLQSNPNRKDLAVGAIVDLRPVAGQTLENCFGLFLGFANVICTHDLLNSGNRRLTSVARQMRLNKQHNVAAASQLWMTAALTARWFRPLDKIYQYHRKYMPLAGGISNVNMNRTWAAEFQQDLLRYVRVSPTGPMVPLVLTTTTLGGRLELAMTFRTSIVDPATAGTIADEFLSRVIGPDRDF